MRTHIYNFVMTATLLIGSNLIINANAVPRAVKPVVEVEEDLYTYKPADNGAGPMWTAGNTCIVRVGKAVIASGLDTLADYKPLNNVRWTLYQRKDAGWELKRRGDDTHEREPCPLVIYPDGRLFLSTNPNDCKPDEYDGKATPTLLQFNAREITKTPTALFPIWDRPIDFHGHTYRSYVADGKSKEQLLIYNTAYDRFYWSFRDSRGHWAKQGAFDFPWGAEYDVPEPVRICYPTVALKDRKVFFCGVSDVVEPYKTWRTYKKELTGADWDYDFRRLFFTWSDDITIGKFHTWVEISTRDKTCGWLFPNDLHVGPSGVVHLLWSERAIDDRLRVKFFPDAKQSIALNYAIVRDGKVVMRKAIQEWKVGDASGERAGNGRFQVSPDGRLFVIYYVGGNVSENRIVEVLKDGVIGQAVKVPLQKPLSSFYTATPRAGCAPSYTIDMLGDLGGTMRYARVRLK